MLDFFRPPADPINYEAHDIMVGGKTVHVAEVSHARRLDWAIRTSMERAVQCDDETVAELTKVLAEQRLEPMYAITLERPFILPSLQNRFGSNNSEMRAFAYDAFDELAKYFDATAVWQDWFIAPYFAKGDDTRESFQLGVFVADNFTQTVVE